MMMPRQHMTRVLPTRDRSRVRALARSVDAPRRIRHTLIDFSSLPLPRDVRCALADAFWSHFGCRSTQQIITLWAQLRVFVRFAVKSASVGRLSDVDDDLIARYVDWLNRQRRANGKPWTQSGRAGAYNTLRSLLKWLIRCRPGLLPELHFPFNPFPWRNRDSGHVGRLSAPDLHAILRACERDIVALRALRDRGERERIAFRNGDSDSHLGEVLELIDRDYNGVVPTIKALAGAAHSPLRLGLIRCGRYRHVEPCLYPRPESLLPYYLALLIHTAGNPQPIAEITCDCLRPIPLLDDRQMLVWEKRRAGSTQRRTFRATEPFEPPVLVREIIEWTRRLRPHAPAGVADHLLMFKGARGINAWYTALAKCLIRTDFIVRHGLPHFSLASIRSSVLTSVYRASGDLNQVKLVANHRQLSTTVRYVKTPEVEADNRARIASLQQAFLGHISRPHSDAKPSSGTAPRAPRHRAIPTGPAVSMFGFDCKDPFAGIAPGTHRGELCTNFLGCFTCPNAVIAADRTTLARLLQARDHLRAAAAYVHPARWEAIYAPPLRILEQDILTRFTRSELADAAQRLSSLPPLPDLR